MANIRTRTRHKKVIDGASLEAAGELGVPFGCHSGLCGKCATTVLSGLNNLSAPTEAERAKGLDPARRLMCQVTINRGTVKLDLD